MNRLFAMFCAALSLSAVASENLVPEKLRSFDVPFKGEGKMGMQYIPVRLPKTAKGAVVSCEVKIENVVRGSQPWFDARIMMDFINSEYKKIKGAPHIGGWKGSKDWFAVKKTVQVPEGAFGLAIMPTLFNVKSGAMSIRNLSVVAQDEFVEDPAEKAKREDRQKRKAENAAKLRERRKKAKATPNSFRPSRASWSTPIANTICPPELKP